MISHYNREVYSKISVVSGGDVGELLHVAEQYLDEGCSWESDERGYVTFLQPMGTSEVPT